jgi:uncharacterized protein YebE (UPF0316 family)
LRGSEGWGWGGEVKTMSKKRTYEYIVMANGKFVMENAKLSSEYGDAQIFASVKLAVGLARKIVDRGYAATIYQNYGLEGERIVGTVGHSSI